MQHMGILLLSIVISVSKIKKQNKTETSKNKEDFYIKVSIVSD